MKTAKIMLLTLMVHCVAFGTELAPQWTKEQATQVLHDAIRNLQALSPQHRQMRPPEASKIIEDISSTIEKSSQTIRKAIDAGADVDASFSSNREWSPGESGTLLWNMVGAVGRPFRRAEIRKADQPLQSLIEPSLQKSLSNTLLSTLKYVLEHAHPDLNSLSVKDNNPLITALRYANDPLPIVQLLLDYGADPYLVTPSKGRHRESAYVLVEKSNTTMEERKKLLQLLKDGRAAYVKKAHAEIKAAIKNLPLEPGKQIPAGVVDLMNQYAYCDEETSAQKATQLFQTPEAGDAKAAAAQKVENKQQTGAGAGSKQ